MSEPFRLRCRKIHVRVRPFKRYEPPRLCASVSHRIGTFSSDYVRYLTFYLHDKSMDMRVC